MNNRQDGLSLTTLILWGIVIALLAITGMKVVPSVIEYYNILGAVKKLGADPATRTMSVTEIRKAYERQSAIDDFKSVSPQDLEITKEGGEVIISFSYSQKINLFKNVNLLIDYQGSSQQ